MRRVARIGLVGLAAVAGLAFAEPPKNQPADKHQPGHTQPAGQPEMKLPPGWTEADMQACAEAGTPGEMHAFLAKGVGTWTGKTKMWMAPDTEAMESSATCTITPVMDGRYFKNEMSGEMPGMGPYSGFGLVGYDNVEQKFQSTWIDNHSTGIMYGKGELSSDGKTLTWQYKFNCPMTKQATTMREIETFTGKDSRKWEMWGTDPKSGKEFKMMEMTMNRTGGAPTTPASSTTPGKH